MYIDLYAKLIDDVNAMFKKSFEPAFKFVEKQREQIIKIVSANSTLIIEAMDKYMRHIREETEKYKEYLQSITTSYQEEAPSYFVIDTYDIPQSPEIENSPSRSPPKVLDKIELWYIYLLPMFVRIVLFLESTIFSNYIYEILKYLLQFLGVYL